MSNPTPDRIAAFNEKTKKGNTFVNRYQENRYAPGARKITVLQDVPGKDAFVMQGENGNVSTMSTATLVKRYTEV